jgi:hypothetical protein
MDTKKMAAVTAAVVTYIKTQEEAARFAGSLDSAVEGAVKPVEAKSPVFAGTWAMAGRSDQMQGRTLMQMRIFK